MDANANRTATGNDMMTLGITDVFNQDLQQTLRNYSCYPQTAVGSTVNQFLSVNSKVKIIENATPGETPNDEFKYLDATEVTFDMRAKRESAAAPS